MFMELTIVPKRELEGEIPFTYKQIISLSGARIRRPLGCVNPEGSFYEVGAQIWMPNNTLLNVIETYDQIKKSLGRNVKQIN